MVGTPTGFLVLLFLVHGGCSVTEGESKPIVCEPGDSGQTVWWFRVKDNDAKVEFIASFNQKRKKSGDMSQKFSEEKIQKHTLILNNFNKEEDSGYYSCAFIQGNKMQFGPVTRLQGQPDTTPEAKIITTTRATPKTTESCERKEQDKTLFPLIIESCNLMILIPLSVGNGLLLILLISTILYCNHIRTRRCPHHYKRQHRNRPQEHRPLPKYPEY